MQVLTRLVQLEVKHNDQFSLECRFSVSNAFFLLHKGILVVVGSLLPLWRFSINSIELKVELNSAKTTFKIVPFSSIFRLWNILLQLRIPQHPITHKLHPMHKPKQMSLQL